MNGLDLQDLAMACVEAGFEEVLVLGSEARLYWDSKPLNECPNDCSVIGWRPEDGERPVLAFAFRDAVRKVAPGSFVMPVCGLGYTALVHGWDGIWPRPVLEAVKPWGGIKATTETECWAKALISLWRAGLLHKGDTDA